MLVLSRKENEKICIGNDITITVCRIRGGKVQIGIEAPYDLLIRREELVSQWDQPKTQPVGG